MKDKIVNLINSKFKGKDVGIGILDCISEKEDVENLAEEIVKLFSIPDVIVQVCPKCKGDQIADTEMGYKCCYTDCLHEWAK